VPGFARGSSPLRGLKAGELMSAMRESERSQSEEQMTMAWPFQRGREDFSPRGPLFAPHARSARSASPFARSRHGSHSVNSGREGDRQNMAVLAATAAAQAEEEAEVDVLFMGGVGRDGNTRPLSPRVRDSQWLDGLSPRLAERGGSRLFPTHLAMPKDRPSPSKGSAKPGGVFVAPGTRRSPRGQGSKKESPQTSQTKPKARAEVKGSEPRRKKEEKQMQVTTRDAPQLPAWAKPLEDKMATSPLQGSSALLGSGTDQEGVSKFQALRQRLENRLKAAEQEVKSTRERLPNATQPLPEAA